MLLVGQSAKAAADDGMFPKVFGAAQQPRRPRHGLMIVGVLMTLVLFATMSPTIADQFSHAVDLAVILIIVPYIYAAIAVLNLLVIQHVSRKVSNIFRALALFAVFYCLWAVVGGDERPWSTPSWPC